MRQIFGFHYTYISRQLFKIPLFLLKRKIQYIFLMIMAFNDFIITTSNSYINKCVWLFVVRVSRNRNHLSKISHWCQGNWCEVFFLQKKKGWNDFIKHKLSSCFINSTLSSRWVGLWRLLRLLLYIAKKHLFLSTTSTSKGV